MMANIIVYFRQLRKRCHCHISVFLVVSQRRAKQHMNIPRAIKLAVIIMDSDYDNYLF
jgi:hypothetical protein